MGNGFKVIGGSSNSILVDDICLWLTREHCKCINPANVMIDTFSDGESQVEIQEDVRGYHVFVIQSLSNPVNHHLVELCLILDALKRSNVKSTTVIIPYYGYGRQDRKVKSRVPISAKAVADMIQASGLDRLVTIDLHAGQIQGFFDVPVDNLYASKVLLKYMNDNKDTVIVSPDKGGVERAGHYAKKLNCGLAFCYKHRDKPNEIAEMRLIGDVKEKKCILVDDMIDTAGTLCKAADVLSENGASSIEAYSTHGIFSGNSVSKLWDSKIEKINITDTIRLTNHVLLNPKFNVIPVSEMVAKSIVNIYEGRSVSELFI
jgi:ribose-phosphate pyrophosphokinase